MKFLIMLLLFSCSSSKNSNISNEDSEVNIKTWIVDLSKEKSIHVDSEYNYFAENEHCTVMWRVQVSKKNMDLWNRGQEYNFKKGCTDGLEKLADLNKVVLGNILKDFKNVNLKSVRLSGSMNALDYSGFADFDVASISSDDPRYLDWRKNYPNHKMHVNKIYVALFNESKSLEKVNSIFKGFGLKLKAKNAEKIFALGVAKLKGRALSYKLLEAGVKETDKVILHAGMLDFSSEKK